MIKILFLITGIMFLRISLLIICMFLPKVMANKPYASKSSSETNSLSDSYNSSVSTVQSSNQRNEILQNAMLSSLEYKKLMKAEQVLLKFLNGNKLSKENYIKFIANGIARHSLGRFTDYLKKYFNNAEILKNVWIIPENGYNPGVGFKDKSTTSIKYFGRYIKQDLYNFLCGENANAMLERLINASTIESRLAIHEDIANAIAQEIVAKVQNYFSKPDNFAFGFVTAEELAQSLADTFNSWMLAR